MFFNLYIFFKHLSYVKGIERNKKHRLNSAFLFKVSVPYFTFNVNGGFVFSFFFSSNAFHKISFHYFWLYSARQRSSASINWKLERKQKLYSVMKTFTIALNIQPNLFRGSDSLSLKTLVVKDTITFRPNCSFFSFSNINRRKLFYIFCSLLILLLFIFLFYIYFNFPF